MNHIKLMCLLGIALAGCKTTSYIGDYGNVNQTQVVLSEANFIVLGSFIGHALEKKSDNSIRNNIGIVAQAKTDLIRKAENAGIYLEGSRVLINITVDFIDNEKHVGATVTADIIEFTK